MQVDALVKLQTVELLSELRLVLFIVHLRTEIQQYPRTLQVVARGGLVQRRAPKHVANVHISPVRKQLLDGVRLVRENGCEQRRFVVSGQLVDVRSVLYEQVEQVDVSVAACVVQ